MKSSSLTSCMTESSSLLIQYYMRASLLILEIQAERTQTGKGTVRVIGWTAGLFSTGVGGFPGPHLSACLLPRYPGAGPSASSSTVSHFCRDSLFWENDSPFREQTNERVKIMYTCSLKETIAYVLYCSSI